MRFNFSEEWLRRMADKEDEAGDINVGNPSESIIGNDSEAKRHRVVARCSNGHEQSIITNGMARESVELWAGLMDGTSPVYVYPPKPEDKSPIGKCAICGAPFQCEVSEL